MPGINKYNFRSKFYIKKNSSNYLYDQTGNLIADIAEGLSVSWNVYGKVKMAQKTGCATTWFSYDPSGNRVRKIDSTSGGYLTNYYIRDVQGNVMAMYERRNDTLFLTEQYIYGSSRLGMKRLHVPMGITTLDMTKAADSLGYRLYELTNHLGNVQLTISDRLVPHNNNGTIDYNEPDVRSATDYYPFGMEMPGRTYPDAMCHYVYHPPVSDSVPLAWTVSNPYFNNTAFTILFTNITGVFDFSLELGMDSFSGYINLQIVDCNSNVVFQANYNSSQIISVSGLAVDCGSYNVNITATGTGFYYLTNPHVYQLKPTAPTVVYMNSNYPYGFNGKFKDNELKGEGNSYDYGARIYDPRIGRWLSLDPLSKKYLNEGNYSYSSDNPIFFIDKEGGDRIIYLYVIFPDKSTHLMATKTIVNFEFSNLKYSESSGSDALGGGTPKAYFTDYKQTYTYDMNSGQTTVSAITEDYSHRHSALLFPSKLISGFIKSNKKENSGGSQPGGWTFTSEFVVFGDGAKTKATDGSSGSVNIDAILLGLLKSTKSLKIQSHDLNIADAASAILELVTNYIEQKPAKIENLRICENCNNVFKIGKNNSVTPVELKDTLGKNIDINKIKKINVDDHRK